MFTASPWTWIRRATRVVAASGNGARASGAAVRPEKTTACFDERSSAASLESALLRDNALAKATSENRRAPNIHFSQGGYNRRRGSREGTVALRVPIRGGEVVLNSHAHVVGDIHHRRLSIEPGAYFEGRSVCSLATNVQKAPEKLTASPGSSFRLQRFQPLGSFRPLPALQDEVPAEPPIQSYVIRGQIVLALLFGGFGLWASCAPLTSAAIAPGVVKVDTRLRPISWLPRIPLA